MKLLCIADIHGYKEGAEKIKEFAEKENIRDILILGDFGEHGNFSGREEAIYFLNSLRKFNLLVLPGNCDSENLLSFLQEQGVSLHEEVKNLHQKVKIVGFGGSNITPFNTPLEFKEEEIYERLRERIKNEIAGKKFILASHCPPRDTKCDLNFLGEHIGSSAIKKIIQEFQPSLVVSSHVHESGGCKDKIKKTEVGNIGKLSEGNFGIIEIINRKITLKLKKLPL